VAARSHDGASLRLGPRLAWCLVAFCCASCASHQPRPKAPFAGTADLAIATWNVHGDAGDVGALLGDLRAGRLTGGAPPRDVVVLLQEASPRSRSASLHWFFAPARTSDGIERGNAILSSLPLREARAIELPRERQRRVAAVANVSVRGVEIAIVNVHLENRASWWKGGLPGDVARARQMDALLAQLPPGPGLLGGDLNTWLGPNERAHRAALARFPDLADSEPLLTFRERLALDHLLFRLPPGWRGDRARAAHRYGSDHYPVIGVLSAGDSNCPCPTRSAIGHPRRGEG
jgi:endonuclease/exonuclease/phosphatase family metal-dependent hydrolase